MKMFICICVKCKCKQNATICKAVKPIFYAHHMFKQRHFNISQKMLSHFKFDGKNMSQKSWDWDNKMLERFYIIQYHQKNQRMWRNLCVHGTILDSLWPLGPEETQALNTGIIVSWKSVHGGRNTSRKYYLWTQFTINTGCIIQRRSHMYASLIQISLKWNWACTENKQCYLICILKSTTDCTKQGTGWVKNRFLHTLKVW